MLTTSSSAIGLPFGDQVAPTEAHLEFMDGHRKSAYDAHHRAEAFILPQLGDIEVSALTTERIRKWHIALAQAPARMRSPKNGKQRYRQLGKDADSIRRRQASANRNLTQLKAALNAAWRDGRTPSDAAWRRVRPFPGADAARTRFLTIEECRRLINASPPEFRRLVQAALTTGARYGELCRLQARDFDPDSGTVAIQISKTGRPRRIILTSEGVALFRELCAGRASDEILLRRQGGQPRRCERHVCTRGSARRSVFIACGILGRASRSWPECR